MRTDIPVIWNVEQTAERLGLSVSTLAKMRLSGTGPAFSKLGRRVFYSPKDVADWIEKNRFNSTSEYPATGT